MLEENNWHPPEQRSVWRGKLFFLSVLLMFLQESFFLTDEIIIFNKRIEKQKIKRKQNTYHHFNKWTYKFENHTLIKC